MLEHSIDNKDITINGNFYSAKYIADISGNDFVFGAGYYKLIITAITTDLGKELELYNNVLTNPKTGKHENDHQLFYELDVPVFGLTQTAGMLQDGMEPDGKTPKYNYYIIV